MKSPVFLLILLVGFVTLPAVLAQDAAELPSWIWSSKKALGDEEVFFQKEFSVPASVEQVILLGSVDNEFSAHVNGARRPSLEGTAWEKPSIADISDQVKKGGSNVITVRAKNGGGAAAALFVIKITEPGGKTSRIVSDATWEVSSKVPKGWNRTDKKLTGKDWNPAVVLGKAGSSPWTAVDGEIIAALLDLKEPTATPVSDIKLPEGFQAELLYSVPKSDQGSWVAMTIDDKQRLIVSDQYGAFYRLPIPAPGEVLSRGDVEKFDLDIGGAQGLLYAFDSLYCVLNTKEHGGRGLYRLTDTDGDDQYDKKELLRKFDEVGGEHGPHAVVKGPDGESIYVVIGDQTPVTELDSSRVPQVWDEDLLLERPYGRGFMKGTLAPGGWIAKTDPEGKKWELVATGFRNEYDAAFDQLGSLFTYDADMEWDMNTPWYRPTRINHVTSGAEFGWRNGGGKWPAYYPDSLPAVVDIGPGSPTGVVFGYGTKFPAKYQKAFFAADWSYGKLYAVHLEQDGASYKGSFEEFMSASPLPLTDLVVNPKDGALYITIGGRRVQSGLYRVTYKGGESTEPVSAPEPTEEFKLRLELEAMHKDGAGDLDKAWASLGHPDRFVRFAARIAVEHQPVKSWQERALAETSPTASINVLIALARHGDKSLQPKIFEALNRIDYGKLSRTGKIDLVRAYSLAFTRMGEGDDASRKTIAEKFKKVFPAKSPELNTEILQLLVYLQTPEAAASGIALLKNAPSQEEQMAYAKSLRHLKEGWTRELRKDFFTWFTRAAGYKGGASFGLFIENMKKDALANTPKAEVAALRDVIEAEAPKEQTYALEPRSFVQAWKVEDFDDVLAVGLEGGRDFTNGRRMFGAGTCFTCHRFNQEGGAIGPDLTSVAGKFSPRDLLESIIEPSKEISDQYGQTIFEMKNGDVVIGRIMNLSGDSFRVNTNMMNPDETVGVNRPLLKSMKESPVSMMPPGLIYTMSKDDVLDLLAYLLSKGDPDDPLFQK